MVILIIRLLLVTDSGLGLPGTSFLVMKTLHTLETSLRSLVLLLQLGDLGAHRMQLLKLILKSLLLHHELVLLLLLLRILRISHLLHREGPPWRQPIRAHLPVPSCRCLHHLQILLLVHGVEHEAHLLRALAKSLIPIGGSRNFRHSVGGRYISVYGDYWGCGSQKSLLSALTTIQVFF